MTQTEEIAVRAVSSFRDPGSERLRADSIASWFRLSQDDMARLLTVTPAYLQHSPASPRLQPKLAVFESIATTLTHFVGAEAAQTWLNLPNQEIDEITPLTLKKSWVAWFPTRRSPWLRSKIGWLDNAMRPIRYFLPNPMPETIPLDIAASLDERNRRSIRWPRNAIRSAKAVAGARRDWGRVDVELKYPRAKGWIVPWRPGYSEDGLTAKKRIGRQEGSLHEDFTGSCLFLLFFLSAFLL